MKNKVGYRVVGRAGFTLVEILLVVVILGILAAIAIPKFTGKSEMARQSSAMASIKAIKLAIDTYEVDTGKFPPTLQGLVNNPGEANWSGPYLRDGLPKDPWGNEFIYSAQGNTYTVTSSGIKEGGGTPSSGTGAAGGNDANRTGNF